MSQQQWETIWNKRTNAKQTLDLAALIALDGFDSGAGKIETDAWRGYAEKLAQLMKLKTDETVYEVGCGSGALLFALTELQKIQVAGIDYSLPLIEAARSAMPEGVFECKNAVDLSILPPVDHVLSNSVFQYLPHADAAIVLHSMISKAKSTVFILDVPALNQKERSETVRRASLSADEYAQKYEGLSHSYYTPEWFEEICAQHPVSCRFIEGIIPRYKQNEYRFGCLIHKHQ